VTQVVRSTAEWYDLDLSDDVVNELVDVFLGPTRPTTKPIASVSDRRALGADLFAPRAIKAAMRALTTTRDVDGGETIEARVRKMKERLRTAAEESAAAADAAAPANGGG
jgi:hypothetical protein